MEGNASPLRPCDDGVLIELRVRPGSSRSGPLEVREGRLVLALHATPERGKANREALRLLAKMLGKAVSELELIRGTASRNKTVLVRGISTQEVEARLSAYITIK